MLLTLFVLVFCGQTKEFYSFEPDCVRPGLATGGLRIGFHRNLIGMSSPYKECGLSFLLIQNHWYPGSGVVLDCIDS